MVQASRMKTVERTVPSSYPEFPVLPDSVDEIRMIQSVDVLGVCPPEVSREVREIAVVAVVHVQTPNRIVFFKFYHAVLPFFYAEVLHYPAPVVRGLHRLSDAFSVHVKDFVVWVVGAKVLQQYECRRFFRPRLLVLDKRELSVRFWNYVAADGDAHELTRIGQA